MKNKYIVIISTLFILSIFISSVNAGDGSIIGTVTVIAIPTTPSIHSSSGSSGSYGSGGVITNEPFENIFSYQTVDGQISASNPTIFNFKNTIIYKVTIDGKENDLFAVMRIENLKSRSNKTPTQPVGEVYMFVNAYLNTVRINSATLSFKVPISWLAENNIETIQMLVWEKDAWKTLPITMIGQDSEYAYFDAVTSHLSNFAVVGTKISTPQIIKPIETVQQTIETTPAPTIQTTTSVETTPKPSSGFSVISMVLILFGVVYMIRRKD